MISEFWYQFWLLIIMMIMKNIISMKKIDLVITAPQCIYHQWTPSLSHYNDIIMGTMASQITSLTIVYSTFYLGADQRKHQSSASLAFVRGIHRRSVNSPHIGPVPRKMFPFDDVNMITANPILWRHWQEWLKPSGASVYSSVRKSDAADVPVPAALSW